MAQRALTAERLRERLDYDPETGVFRWRTIQSRVFKGSVAGNSTHVTGYVRIGIDGCVYLAHRLAWLHVYGEWPQGLIDHINRIRSDNRISNLRVVNARANCINKTMRDRQLPTGVKHIPRGRRQWAASIMVQKKSIHLGTFDTIDDAASAYRAAKSRIMEAVFG